MTRKHDKALVTLAIGDDYTRMFLDKVRPTWQAYCERHGYDLVLLTELIDPGVDLERKSIHWQKLLIGMVPQLREYGHIVWMDGDILINHRMAPCIVSALEAEGGGIGVVDISGSFRAPDSVFNRHVRFLILNLLMLRKATGKPERAVFTDGDLADYYAEQGFRGRADRFINTGVMAFDPSRHGDFLGEVYLKYERDYQDFENTPLSYELQVSGRARYLPSDFNRVWAEVAAHHYPFLFDPETRATAPELMAKCVNTAYHNTWFLHFAGARRNPVTKYAFELVDPKIADVMELAFPDHWPDFREASRFCRLRDARHTVREWQEQGLDFVAPL